MNNTRGDSISFTELKLHKPHKKFKHAFLKSYLTLVEMADKIAWLNLGDAIDLMLPENDFELFVNELCSRELVAAEGFVCDTVYWVFWGDNMVGRISLRHELNDFLRRVGGHIGYIVHPNWRNRGIASGMLKEILKTKRAKDIGSLLVTCDEDNIASEKTILKNGGVFKEKIFLSDRKAKKHFWIFLN